MILMILEKSLRFLVIGAIFLLTLIPFIVSVPLFRFDIFNPNFFIVGENLFFPYITGKNFAFRILVEIMAGGWLALALINPAYRPRRSWVLTAFTVFVLLIGLSNALGAYPFKSFWSNYERMDGWVTLAHLLVYLFVAASMMKTEMLWRRLFQVSLALSACISIYGFLQVIDVVEIGNGAMAGLTARIDSTFGNPIYLAAFMLFNVFIAALLVFQSSKKKWSSMERIVVGIFMLCVTAIFADILKKAGAQWHPYAALIAFDAIVMGLIFLRQNFILSFILVLDVITLLLTSTRGTILGLLGGSVLAAVLVAFFERPTRGGLRSSSLAWRIAVGYIALIIIAAGSFLAVRNTTWIQGAGFLGRLATISLSESTSMTRIINWSIAWEGVKERPLLGWGQENFALVFDKYYDPRMYKAEPWFDRVHNIIFDWLIAGGFFGLFSYLSIFAAALWALWRRGFSTVEASIFTGLLAGYFLHNFFVFDNITSYILFVTILGYIAWRSSAFSNEPPLWQWSLPRKYALVLAVAMAILVGGAYFWINAAALDQNRLLIQAIVPQPGGIAKNLELMKSSIGKGTFGMQEAREQLAQIASRIAGATDVDFAQKQAFYDAAVSEMKLQQDASPLDARFPLFLGIVYNSFGNYAAGAQALQRAHELSLKKQSILYEIAQNAQERGDTAGALKALETAYSLETTNVQARIMYAAMLISTGNSALADGILAPLLATGEAADPRITSAYVAIKKYDKVVAVWEAFVKVQPNDLQGYFTLAAAYYGMGDTAKAIATIEAASRLSPDAAKQAADFIGQIRSGTVQLQ